MNYADTLEYLYAQLPMFTRVGAAAYKKDLFNIQALCEALHHPQKKFKSIHVAGTNGKGSTCHMLASILQEAGFKTGLYTSPHIKAFGERIRVNGKMIDEQFVVDFVERNRGLTETVKPSFFELTVAMAFAYFAKEKVDFAIIETGLGGRLDSTNLIEPELSVITNIGYDHMQILGDSLEKIASEKAGIIKHNTPVVIGKIQEETKGIFTETAAKLNAEIEFAENHFSVVSARLTSQRLTCTVINKFTNQESTYQLDLTGGYQQENLCTVLSCVSFLNQMGYPISETVLSKGLSQTKINTGIRGRWEILEEQPLVILDVAHNESGIQWVLNQLQQHYAHRKIHFIIGFAKDKDISGVLKLFPKEATYYFTQAHSPRALPMEELHRLATLQGLNGNRFQHVNEALAFAKSKADPQDVIVICGSFYVISELN